MCKGKAGTPPALWFYCTVVCVCERAGRGGERGEFGGERGLPLRFSENIRFVVLYPIHALIH